MCECCGRPLSVGCFCAQDSGAIDPMSFDMVAEAGMEADIGLWEHTTELSLAQNK